jgi:hypothetical protein
MAVSGQFQGSFNRSKKWEAVSRLPPIPKTKFKKTSIMH